jgi:catechol 2,3-dioxygenase-like lactoylglutathione lyase family enzyme
MAFHHVAVATRDLDATHRFYTDVMGFTLVKVVAAPTPGGTGFAKHLFYDTGDGELMAFWDLHDPAIGDAYGTDLNDSLGLPVWVNHLAFDAPTRDHLDAVRRRWVDHGITVLEVDHEWCVSIYTRDPNGIMVEFCHTTRDFDVSDHAEAAALLGDPAPPLGTEGSVTLHRASTTSA